MADEYKVKLKFIPDTSSLKKSLGSLGNVGVGGFGKGGGGGFGIGKSLLSIVGFLSILAPIFRVLSLILRPIKDILYIALLPILYLLRPIGIFFQTVLRPYIQRALIAQRLGLEAQAAGQTGVATSLFLESARIIGLGFVDLIVQSLAGFSGMVLRAFGFEEMATVIEISAANFSQNLLTSIDTSLAETVKMLERSGVIDEATSAFYLTLIASLTGGIEEADLGPITTALNKKMVMVVDGVVQSLSGDESLNRMVTKGKWQLGGVGAGALGGFGAGVARGAVMGAAGGPAGIAAGAIIGGVSGALLGAILGGTIGGMIGDFINNLESQDTAVQESENQALMSYENISNSIGLTNVAMTDSLSQFNAMDKKSINWTINVTTKYKTVGNKSKRSGR